MKTYVFTSHSRALKDTIPLAQSALQDAAETYFLTMDSMLTMFDAIVKMLSIYCQTPTEGWYAREQLITTFQQRSRYKTAVVEACIDMSEEALCKLLDARRELCGELYPGQDADLRKAVQIWFEDHRWAIRKIDADVKQWVSCGSPDNTFLCDIDRAYSLQMRESVLRFSSAWAQAASGDLYLLALSGVFRAALSQ